MSLMRLLLGMSPLLLLGLVVILPQHHQVSGLFIWPRLVPYYYPLPVSSSSEMSSSAASSFPSSVHSGTQYMYDWNTYNQNYPHSSSVLFPSSSSSSSSSAGGGVSGSSGEQSSMMPSSGAVMPSIGHRPFSGLTRWFHKPWFSWKLAKFGLRSPSSSSPCSSSVPPMGSHGHGSLTSTLFPSLSSASLTSSAAAASPSPPCTTRVFTCCNAHSGGPSPAHPAPPSFIQTHVNYDPHSPTYQDRRISTSSSSGHHYPSNYISYSSGAGAAPSAASSMESESVSQVASDPMSISYDFISSR